MVADIQEGTQKWGAVLWSPSRHARITTTAAHALSMAGYLAHEALDPAVRLRRQSRPPRPVWTVYARPQSGPRIALIPQPTERGAQNRTPQIVGQHRTDALTRFGVRVAVRHDSNIGDCPTRVTSHAADLAARVLRGIDP